MAFFAGRVRGRPFRPRFLWAPVHRAEALCFVRSAIQAANGCARSNPGAVEGGIDAGSHGGKPVGGAEEGGYLRQDLIGPVDEPFVADAHYVDAESGAPAFGMALLLPVRDLSGPAIAGS